MERTSCSFVKATGFCENYSTGSCSFKHPPMCRNAGNCFRSDCTFLHPNAWCPINVNNCGDYECPFRHEQARRPLCRNGKDCPNSTCFFLHPVSWLPNRCSSDKCEDALCPKNHPKSQLECYLVTSEAWKTLPKQLTKPRFLKLRKSIKIALANVDSEIKSAMSLAFGGLKKVMLSETSEAETTRQVYDALTARLVQLRSQRSAFCSSVHRTLIEVANSPNKAEQCRIHPTVATAIINRDTFRLKAKLPALAKRQDIEEGLASRNQFMIVKGHTGSGKSTQLPQFIADNPAFIGKKVICTEPRKIAAVSLAERVAFEFSGGNEQSKVGKHVGYRVGGCKNAAPRAAIEFATEGVLLPTLAAALGRSLGDDAAATDDKQRLNLAEVGAVIVDEAHERNVSTDVLLGLLKKIAPSYPNMKVIITSATINEQQFSDFFNKCPIVEIPGRTFPVDVVYEGDGADNVTTSNVTEAIVRKAVDICQTSDPSTGDILCFLMGQMEVENATMMCQQFLERYKLGKVTSVFSLYGKQTPDQQQEVFKKLPAGHRKVIFATDIAETSITIDGVRYVVDCGLTKDTVYDSRLNMTSLKVIPISKNSAEQRKGRAGRTAPGICYRLYSKATFDELNDSSVPEIRRRPLSLTVASLFAMGIDPFSFCWFERPDDNALKAAVEELRLLGALDNHNKLTDIGSTIVLLQVDPCLGRMIHRACYDGFGEAATMIAGLLATGGMVFWRGGDDATKAKADEAKRQFLSNHGDVVTLYRTYLKWLARRDNKQIASVQSANNKTVGVEFSATFGTDVQDIGTNFAATRIVEDNRLENLEAVDDESSSEAGGQDEVTPDDDSDDAASVSSTASEAVDIKEAADDVIFDRAAQSESVKQWCRQNYINNKAMNIARTSANEMKRQLAKKQFWQAKPQNREPTDQDVKRLALLALTLNTAVKIAPRQYKVLQTGLIGTIHPSSAMASVEDEQLKYIVFHNVLETSRVFLNVVTPVEFAWIEETSGDLATRFAAKEAELNTFNFRLEDVPIATLRALFGKFNAHLATLSKELNCMLQPDYDSESITVWCRQKDEAPIRNSFMNKINLIKERAAAKVVEEVLSGGGNRIVWGAGGVTKLLLFGKEHVSVNIRNLPAEFTEDSLRSLLLRKLKSDADHICDCSIVPARNAGDQVWANVVFKHSEVAARAIGELNGEVVGGQAISVSARGILQPSMFHELSAKVTLSFANGPSTGSAIVSFSTADEGNRALQVARKLFGTSVTLAAIGQKQTNNPGIVDPSRRVKPRLDQLGRFATTNGVSSYAISLSSLPLSCDEKEISDKFKTFGLQTIFCSVKRTVSDKAGSSQQLLLEVEELCNLIPFSKNIVSRTTFTNDSQLRGGICGYFSSANEAMAMSDLIAEQQKKMPKRFDQPVRLELDFSQRLAVHAALWKKQEDQLVKLVAAVNSQPGVSVNVDRSSSHVTLRFRASDTAVLDAAKAKVDQLLRCTIFTHPQKHLLFSFYGRAQLQTFSTKETEAYIHWDNSTQIIRIYGSDSEQTRCIRRLESLTEELKTLKLDVVKLVKRTHRKTLGPRLDTAEKQEAVKKQCGLRDLRYYQRNGKILASGSDESIKKLEELFAECLALKQNGPLAAKSDECPLCFDKLENRITLQLCGHKFCHGCIAAPFKYATIPVPFKCPVEKCNKDLSVQDIVNLCPDESRESFRQHGLCAFLRQPNIPFRRCLNPECSGVTKVQTTDDTLFEVKNGGVVAACDQCRQVYCVRCSETLKKVVVRHPGKTCESYMSNQSIDNKVRIHWAHIAEELCAPRCPNCRLMFDSWEGCFAVQCLEKQHGGCGSYFCGFCMKPCGGSGDCHGHVRSCSKNPTKGEYFGRIEVFLRLHRERQALEIEKYISSIPEREIQQQVLKIVRKELPEYGIKI